VPPWSVTRPREAGRWRRRAALGSVTPVSLADALFTMTQQRLLAVLFCGARQDETGIAQQKWAG